MSIEKSEKQEDSDDNEPLLRYLPPGPSSVQQKKSNSEAQFLAQYEARRDAKLRQAANTKKTSSGEPETNPAVAPPQSDDEKEQLMVQLQAEKKKKEVVCAEKIIAETKYKTLKQTLEKERDELQFTKDKLTVLEDEKKKLAEALEAAENKSAMVEAMHERVWSSPLITLKIIRDLFDKTILLCIVF